MTPTATRVRQDLALGFEGVSPDDVVSVAGVAETLGVGIATAHRYVNRDDFPQPIGRAAQARVWLKQDVELWAKEMLPLKPGRRPREEKHYG